MCGHVHTCHSSAVVVRDEDRRLLGLAGHQSRSVKDCLKGVRSRIPSVLVPSLGPTRTHHKLQEESHRSLSFYSPNYHQVILTTNVVVSYEMLKEKKRLITLRVRASIQFWIFI